MEPPLHTKPASFSILRTQEADTVPEAGLFWRLYRGENVGSQMRPSCMHVH